MCTMWFWTSNPHDQEPMRALQGVIVSLNHYCGWAWKIVAVCAMEMMLLGENEVPEMLPSRSARPEGPRYLDYLKTNWISVDQVHFKIYSLGGYPWLYTTEP
jgi:hypothetical protein